MAKLRHLGSLAAAIFIASGIVLFILPRNWMELWLGNAPDGGTGLLESVLAPGAIAIGLALVLLIGRLRRGARENLNPRAVSPLQRDAGESTKHAH